jgi:hypothetical protein
MMQIYINHIQVDTIRYTNEVGVAAKVKLRYKTLNKNENKVGKTKN